MRQRKGGGRGGSGRLFVTFSVVSRPVRPAPWWKEDENICLVESQRKKKDQLHPSPTVNEEEEAGVSEKK